MIKVLLEGGAVFSGSCASDIIVQLKLEDWTQHSSVEQYQQNMARRVKNFNGQTISYETDMEFLQELQRIGFIRLISFQE